MIIYLLWHVGHQNEAGVDGDVLHFDEGRLTLAAALAAVVAYSAAQETTTMLGSALPGSLLAAFASGVILVGIYLAGARALRVREVDVLTRRVTARLRPPMPR